MEGNKNYLGEKKLLVEIVEQSKTRKKQITHVKTFLELIMLI